MVCTLGVPPDITKMKNDDANISSPDAKDTNPDEVFEILMDVPSSSHFVDITTNILTQLGVSHNIEATTKGSYILF